MRASTNLIACAALAVGCVGKVSEPGTPEQPPTTDPLCTGQEVVVPRRLVRLTFNQVHASVRSLLGDAAAAAIAAPFELGDLTQRTFPPLLSAREGANITEVQWAKGDGIAQAAARYVADNLAAVTGCGAAPTAACAQSYVATFAERAFRRPLTDAEKARLAKADADFTAAGGTVAERVQYGVYAVLEAPQFLYRTELGNGALTPYEQASQLAFFLTDGPPDAELLAAAAAGRLSTRVEVEPQVTRLLATPAARANLQAAMFAYFSIPNVESVVIDPGKVPAWNDGLRNSMYHESELFLADVLWSGPLSDLLTARRTRINAGLAALYGVAAPDAATQDADGFGPVELPAARAGLLTQAGFLTSRARPDQQSVVGRGLLVNAAFLCAQNPPFPENLADQIAAVNMMLSNQTEKQKADYRASTSPCMTCHPGFDPYGLVLESFDLIGQYRTADAMGRPIDTTVTLPPTAGGGTIASARELAERLAGGGAFAACMTRNLIGFALADRTVGVGDCATAAVATRLQASADRSFTTLMREIALSRTLAVRTAGTGGAP